MFKKAPTKIEQKKNFGWSIKPFNICMIFVFGFNLNITKHTNIVVRFAGLAFGVFFVISHLIINGPCGLFRDEAKYNIYKEEDTLLQQINPNTMNAKDVLYIVSDLIKFTLFVSTPLIHLIFMRNILMTKKWENLWRKMKKIQRQMKLDDLFYCKLRRGCLIALAFLILVTIEFLIIRKVIICNNS